jgi:hypothetical protein
MQTGVIQWPANAFGQNMIEFRIQGQDLLALNMPFERVLHSLEELYQQRIISEFRQLSKDQFAT